jgi:excisionase family DNA binding protein
MNSNVKGKLEYLSLTEAQEMTGVSRFTWRLWVYNRRIESVKLGGRVLIPRRAIEEMIAENTRPRAAAASQQHSPEERATV